MIEAVLFDIDGTLLDHNSASSAALDAAVERELPGIDAAGRAAAAAEWRRLEELHYSQYLSGELSLAEMRRRRAGGLLEALDRPSRAPADLDAWFDDYLRGYRDSWALFDDVEPALEAVDGNALGVITNAEAKLQRAKLAAFGLDRRLPALVASSEVGVAKPLPGIFAAACRLVGLPPGRIAYVGDRLETDARGARDAGMLGIWLNRDTEVPGVEDVPTISTLTELVDLL